MPIKKEYLALFTNGRYLILEASSESEARVLAKMSAEQSRTRLKMCTEYSVALENDLIAEYGGF